MVVQGDNCGYVGENGTALLQQNCVLGLTPVSAGGRKSWWAGFITCLLGEGEALAPAALEAPGSGLSSSLTSSFWGQAGGSCRPGHGTTFPCPQACPGSKACYAGSQQAPGLAPALLTVTTAWPPSPSLSQGCLHQPSLAASPHLRCP